MTSIDSTSQFLAQIANQVSAIGRKSSLLEKTKGKEKGSEKKGVSQENLDELVTQRILSIDPGDPHSKRKAFRVFLESILINELGGNTLNDPAFHRMLDEVQRTMESDTDLLPSIEKAGEFLLSKASRKV